MMSCGANPTRSVSSRYERSQTSTLRRTESAWPVSSKAMTMTAAPYLFTIRACRRNSSSPSFMEIELTTPFPWRQRSPDSMTLNLELSTMIGTREMSGSDASSLRYLSMAASESSIPSSMFTSSICAPSSTCCLATDTASSYLSERISRLKRAEPVTLARSPTLTKLESALISRTSNPLRTVFGFSEGLRRGLIPATASAIALVCSGLEPQQLPTMLARPFSAKSLRLAAMWDADSSYSPNSLGSPAFG